MNHYIRLLVQHHFGREVRRRLFEAGWSLKDLSHASGVSERACRRFLFPALRLGDSNWRTMERCLRAVGLEVPWEEEMDA